MKPFAVRQATLSDLEALIPLFDSYRRFYGKPSDPNAAKSFLRDRFEHGEDARRHHSSGWLPALISGLL